jgi:hypothetical protein
MWKIPDTIGWVVGGKAYVEKFATECCINSELALGSFGI